MIECTGTAVWTEAGNIPARAGALLVIAPSCSPRPPRARRFVESAGTPLLDDSATPSLALPDLAPPGMGTLAAACASQATGYVKSKCHPKRSTSMPCSTARLMISGAALRGGEHAVDMHRQPVAQAARKARALRREGRGRQRSSAGTAHTHADLSWIN